MLEEVRAEAEVARTIYRLRSGAGLTQQALAERVGTTASVISRLEDADYTGHSLAMLRRIAAALGRRVEIRFPAVKTIKDPAATGKTSVRSGNRRSRSKSAYVLAVTLDQRRPSRWGLTPGSLELRIVSPELPRGKSYVPNTHYIMQGAKKKTSVPLTLPLVVMERTRRPACDSHCHRRLQFQSLL